MIYGKINQEIEEFRLKVSTASVDAKRIAAFYLIENAVFPGGKTAFNSLREAELSTFQKAKNGEIHANLHWQVGVPDSLTACLHSANMKNTHKFPNHHPMMNEDLYRVIYILSNRYNYEIMKEPLTIAQSRGKSLEFQLWLYQTAAKML